MPRKKTVENSPDTVKEEIKEAAAETAKVAEVTEAEDTQAEGAAVPLDANGEETVEDAPEDLSTDADIVDKLDEMMASLAAFYAQRNARFSVTASKSEKRQLYNSVKVRDKNFNSEVKTEGDLLAQEFRTLAQAMNASPKRILTGYVMGIRESNAFGIEAIIKLEKSNGYYKIFCPASHLLPFENGYPVFLQKNGKDVVQKYLRNRIGSLVDFVVMSVNEKEKTAYVSRLHALSMEAVNNYIKPERGTGLPHLTEGMIVEANIVHTSENMIIVEAGGVEGSIILENLSWKRIADAREVFHIGNKINVKVKKVTQYSYESGDVNIPMVRAEFSAKEATRNPANIFYDKYDIDNEYLAEITQITNREVFVTVGPGEMDCICRLPADRRYADKRGKKVLVKIIHKDDELKRLTGVITRPL